MAKHIREYEYHPFCLAFGLMKQAELENLADSIKSPLGLQKSIVLYQGKILDGRNRSTACKMVGATPTYIEYKGDDAGALAFVEAANFHRRHDTDADRAIQAAKLKPFHASLAAHRKRHNDSPGGSISANAEKGNAIDLAAAAVGASPASAERAAVVLENATPEVVAAMESGEVSISDAAAVAHEPPKEQRAAVKKVRAKKAKTLKAAVKKEPKEAEPEGGWEPGEATKFLKAADKALGQAVRAVADAQKILGKPAGLVAVHKGIDDACMALARFKVQHKRKSA